MVQKRDAYLLRNTLFVQFLSPVVLKLPGGIVYPEKG